MKKDREKITEVWKEKQNEILNEMLNTLTDQEKKTLDKIYNTDEETVLKEFGKPKNDILEKYLTVMTNRRLEKKGV